MADWEPNFDVLVTLKTLTHVVAGNAPPALSSAFFEAIGATGAEHPRNRWSDDDVSEEIKELKIAEEVVVPASGRVPFAMLSASAV